MTKTKLTLSISDEHGNPNWEVSTDVDLDEPGSIISAAKGAAEMFVEDLEEVHA